MTFPALTSVFDTPKAKRPRMGAWLKLRLIIALVTCPELAEWYATAAINLDEYRRMMPPLHLWSNGVDYAIAHTEAEARRLTNLMYGCIEDSIAGEDVEWRMCDPASHFKYWSEQWVEGNERSGLTTITRDRPVQWFIDNYGEGYFACTEF